jgi:hypothetical protein
VRGLWIYLHYVLSEIERGERTPLDLSALPQGIWQYYAQFWQGQRDEAGLEWSRVYLPILSTMAAAQEDLSFGLLCKLAGIESDESLQRIVTETWRPYLSGRSVQEQRYRLYHASLREFFDGRLDSDHLTIQEKSLSLELSKATIQAHYRIADHYLNNWGGLAAALPTLEQTEMGSDDDAYGIRHIVSHLEHAGRANEVHQLLRLERSHSRDSSGTAAFIRAAVRQKWSTETDREDSSTSRAVNLWYEYRESRNDISGYLSDITRAWHLGTQIHTENHNLAPGLPLQFRYALITASLHSLAGTIPPQLLVAAVEKGAWPTVQALSVARHITNVKRRTEALIGLVPYLHPSVVSEVKIEAMSALRSIPHKADSYLHDETERITLFKALANLEKDGEDRDRILDEALANTQRVENEEIRGRLLRLLIPHFPNRNQELLSAAAKMGDAAIQISVISDLIPTLPEDGLQEVVNLALTLKAPHLRTLLLNEIILETDVSNKRDLLSEAVRSGILIEDAYKKVVALSRLLPSLEDVAKRDVVDEIILAARAANDEHRLWLLSELPFLLRGFVSEEIMKQVADEALATARRLNHLIERATKLERLIPFMPEDQQDLIHEEVLGMIRAEPKNSSKVGLLQIIASYVPDDKKPFVLHEALDVALAIPDANERERNLSELITSFDENEAKQIIKVLAESSTDETNNDTTVRISRDSAAKTIGRALIVASDRDYYRSGSQLFIGLLSSVPTPFKQSVLQAALVEALTALDGERRNRLLNAITQHVSVDTIREALKAVRSVGDECEIGEALATLQLFIDNENASEVVQGVIEIAKAMRFPNRAVHFLLPVIACIDSSEKEDLLKYTLSLLRSIKDHNERTHALVRAVSILPSDIKEAITNEALNEIRGMPDGAARLNNFTALLPHFSEAQKENVIQECFTQITALADAERKTGALRNLIQHLPGNQRATVINDALDSARTLEGGGKRARTLSTLLQYLSDEEKTAVLAEAIAAALTAEDDEDRSWALRSLVAHMPQESLLNTMSAALAMNQVVPKAELLLALLKHCPTKVEELYEEILKCIHESEDDDKTTILMSLVDVLPEVAVNELLMEARKLQGRNRVYVLSMFIRKTSAESKLSLISETIETIRSIDSLADRAHVVLYLTPHLADELKQLQSSDGSDNNTQPLLRDLASLFQESLPIVATKTRYDLLKETYMLAHAISALAGQAAVIEIVRAIRDVGSWWP